MRRLNVTAGYGISFTLFCHRIIKIALLEIGGGFIISLKVTIIFSNITKVNLNCSLLC